MNILVEMSKVYIYSHRSNSELEPLDLLGQLYIGSFFFFFLTIRETGEKYAMKTINILGFNRQQKDRLIQEVLILARLHHPNIVKLYEVYETPKAIYLIQELLSGGELYTRLVNSPRN